jgi:hypothetical protein
MGTSPALPRWTDASGAASACGACHGTPPGFPHGPGTACGTCHSGIAELGPTGLAIAPAKAGRHADGVTDRGAP